MEEKGEEEGKPENVCLGLPAVGKYVTWSVKLNMSGLGGALLTGNS